MLGEELRQPRLDKTLAAKRRSPANEKQHVPFLVFVHILLPAGAISHSALLPACSYVDENRSARRIGGHPLLSTCGESGNRAVLNRFDG